MSAAFNEIVTAFSVAIYTPENLDSTGALQLTEFRAKRWPRQVNPGRPSFFCAPDWRARECDERHPGALSPVARAHGGENPGAFAKGRL